MLYLEDIYSFSHEQIANQNLVLFFEDRESFDKIKDVCYKPVLAIQMYNDAVKTGYQPLIDAMKIALEGSVQNVKLLLSK